MNNKKFNNTRTSVLIFTLFLQIFGTNAQFNRQMNAEHRASSHNTQTIPNVKEQNLNSNLKLYLSKTVKSMDDVVYPEMEERVKNDMRRAAAERKKIKTNCVYGLCEDVEDYPVDHISKLINQTNAYEDYFKNIIPAIDLGNRYNLDDSEEPLCDTRTITVFPQKANNTKRVERTIINVKDKYTQGIKSETCLGDGAKCKFGDMFPAGYSAYCKQKFVTRKLMILNEEDEKKIAFDTFDVPSCCVCVLKKD